MGGPPTGFWARVEAWLVALLADRRRFSRYMLVAYWISTGFVLVGVGVILAVKLGVWP